MYEDCHRTGKVVRPLLLTRLVLPEMIVVPQMVGSPGKGNSSRGGPELA